MKRQDNNQVIRRLKFKGKYLNFQNKRLILKELKLNRHRKKLMQKKYQ
jgi:hypothetical protein